MAVTINNECFIGHTFKPLKLPDPFARGADVVKVANGFVVMPSGSSGAGDRENTFIFRDSTELAAWMRKRYPGKAA
jgi:hypothetical protein